jgi:hypothetical protein
MKNRKREICTSGSVRDEDGQPPHLLGFILCAASLNGSVFCIRTAGSDREILAEHYEGGSFQLPINIMVIDQTGEAARIAIEAEGLKFH